MKTEPLLFAIGCLMVVACSDGSSTTTSAAASCSEPATNGQAATTRQALDVEGRCSGTPRGCSLFAATACRQQEGCYPVRGNPSTYADDHCDGSPPSCERRSSESSCEEIRGCRWEAADGTTSTPSASSEETTPCAPETRDAGPDPSPSPTPEPIGPTGPSGPSG